MSEKIQASDAERRLRLQTWLRIDARDKAEVYKQVFKTAEFSSLTYWLELIFSAGIATFGLVENSPAVIIGAMLISPLMGPIMAVGLALAVGDLYLGLKAVLNLLASLTVSIAFSGILVWLLPFHSSTSEIISRTNPNLLDLGIALFSGLAGSVVVCRGGAGDVTVLPGTAIAVALMPPLCVMGFGLGSGLNLEIMGGAGLLFLTNLVAIVASAFLIFLLVGMSTPEVRQAMVASRGQEPRVQLLSHGPISRILATGGQLRWRVLMLLVLLGFIAVPLRRALLQVASEIRTRATVQDELKRLVPADAIVTQQVSVDKNEILIRVIATRQIPESKVAEVRKELMRRTGHNVELSVDAVASKSELAELLERLARPAQIIPNEKTVTESQKELLGRVRPAIEESWPSADAPIEGFNVVLGPAGIEIDVRYHATKDLSEAQIDSILHSLRNQLGIQDLTLKAERLPLAPASQKRP